MNILFLMKYYELGGQEVVTNFLGTHFSVNRHQVSIASFNKPSLDMLANHNPRISLFQIKGGYTISKVSIASLRDILIEKRIDVIINQWGLPFVPIYVAKRASKNLNVKLISVYHHIPGVSGMLTRLNTQLDNAENWGLLYLLRIKREALRFVTKMSMRYVYYHSHRYVVLSNSYKSIFEEFTGIKDPKKLVAITNPITIEHNFEYSFELKKKEILYVGRIDYYQKRVYRIIDLWRKLEPLYPEWKLVLVGDGKERKSLEDYAKEKGLRNCSFEGFRDPEEYYTRASLLLLTSDFEGFPLVVIESMSFGVVPIVYGSYPAVYDIIKDGVNGTIVFPVDGSYSEEEMLNSIKLLISDKLKRREMALNAVISSNDYHIDNVAHSWDLILRDNSNL